MTKSRKTATAKAKPKKRVAATRLPRPDRRKKTERIEWESIVVAVSYEPDWLGIAKRLPEAAVSHLEIRVVSPERAVLPVTDTGYRSQFLSHAVVERAGGPVAYAKAWLDAAAKVPAWKKRQEQSRQLCLF